MVGGSALHIQTALRVGGGGSALHIQTALRVGRWWGVSSLYTDSAEGGEVVGGRLSIYRQR